MMGTLCWEVTATEFKNILIEFKETAQSSKTAKG